MPKEFSLGDLNVQGGASDRSFGILKLLQLKIYKPQRRTVFSFEFLFMWSFKYQLQILRIRNFFTKIFYDVINNDVIIWHLLSSLTSKLFDEEISNLCKVN